ncbi:hypothetical protein ACPC54_39880 [Kitasatospora sp. NPDC094028]
MTQSHYVPAFTHTDWIDNEDRVQAAGENGFNIRFHNLESEFRTLADGYLNPMIDTVFRTVTSCLSLTPILAPDQPGKPGWELNFDVAQKPATATEAHGIMNVVLPDHVVIKSLMVSGDREPNPPGAVPPPVFPTIVLRSMPVTGSGQFAEIVTVSGFGVAVPPKPGAQTTVDNTANKYFIEADLAPVTATDTVKLFCFQITYQ